MSDTSHNIGVAFQGVGYILTGVRSIVGALLLGGLALNVANIVGRYLLHKPIIAAEELLSFSMVWCIFLGAVLVTWDGRHLRMDILYYFLPGRIRRILSAVVILVFVAVGSIVAVQSWRIVELVGRLSEVSVVAEVPMTVPWASIPISFALMVCLVVLRARTILSGRLDDESRTAELGIGEEFAGGGDRP